MEESLKSLKEENSRKLSSQREILEKLREKFNEFKEKNKFIDNQIIETTKISELMKEELKRLEFQHATLNEKQQNFDSEVSFFFDAFFFKLDQIVSL